MADERTEMDVGRLVAEHHQAVYRYAFRLAGSVHDAEDLTQQVFLVAQQRLEQLRRPESARSWLFSILRNSFLKIWQRQEPVTATSIGLNLDVLPLDASESDSIGVAGLQQAIGELPPEFRVVLAMFYFEDRSYREIAEDLELPIGTVMSRLARAKGHLRSKLIDPEPPLPRRPKPSPVR